MPIRELLVGIMVDIPFSEFWVSRASRSGSPCSSLKLGPACPIVQCRGDRGGEMRLQMRLILSRHNARSYSQDQESDLGRLQMLLAARSTRQEPLGTRRLYREERSLSQTHRKRGVLGRCTDPTDRSDSIWFVRLVGWGRDTERGQSLFPSCAKGTIAGKS